MKNIIFLVAIAVFAIACSKQPVEKEYVYVPTIELKIDSNYIYAYNDAVANLNIVRDSLDSVKDSLDSVKTILSSTNSELFVAKYKLERIKIYCDLAKKKNNSKYLRGWILRTLND